MSGNEVEVGGDKNRVAGRDYIEVNLGRESRSEPMVPAQRQELYDLGTQCTELGADSKEIWRRVFAELGVKQIGDITAEQFQQARSVLRSRLDQLQEEDDKRSLIGKILRTATEKAARQDLNNFCDRNFGRTHLATLKRADLQRVLAFIQDFEVQPLAAPQPQPAKPERLDLREFLITYKVNAAGLFVCGLIVGTLWF